MKIPNSLINPERLIQLGAGRKLSFGQIWDIFKHMFSLLGQQSTLWTPIIRMIMTNLILLVLFLIGLLSLFTESNHNIGITLLIISIVGALLRGFYFGYLFGLLTAMVYLYLQGKEVSVKAARPLAKHRIFSLSILYILTQFLNAFIHKREDAPGKAKIETLLLGFISTETLNVLGHILVPIMIIENAGLHQSVSHLKQMRQHLPETLAGIFGVDITSKVITTLFLPIAILILVLGFLIGQHFAIHFPPITVLTTSSGGTFSWLPMVIGILFLIFILSFVRPCMDGLKIIYFTLLYAFIAHPDRVQANIRAGFSSFEQEQASK